jgi:hypothetical protein
VLPTSIQPIEIAWTLFGLVPLVTLDCRMLLRLRRASIKLRDDGRNGRDRVTINGHIVSNLIVAAGHTTIMVMGVAAMIAKPVAGVAHVTVTQLVITFGLFILALLFSGFSVSNTYYWARGTREAEKYVRNALTSGRTED